MQILPPKELSSFIKHYLFLESEGNELKKLRLFSDGNMGIVFSFKSNLVGSIEDDGEQKTMPDSFLYGQISAFKDVYLVNDANLVIVVFQPAGINLLLGIPAGELRDTIVDAKDLLGKQGMELYEKLAERTSIQDRLRSLNLFFIDLASKRAHPAIPVINASVELIVKHHGLISSGQLIKFTGYTERHIERMFIKSIGISPKKFSDVIKLHHFLKRLKMEQPGKSLTSLAYEAGYTDQSHLIREFKKFTGMTPRAYINKADKLTVNFIKFLPGSIPVE